MAFDNRLIIDGFADVVNILIRQFSLPLLAAFGPLCDCFVCGSNKVVEDALLVPFFFQQRLGFLLVAGLKMVCHICGAATKLDFSHLASFAVIETEPAERVVLVNFST